MTTQTIMPKQKTGRPRKTLPKGDRVAGQQDAVEGAMKFKGPLTYEDVARWCRTCGDLMLGDWQYCPYCGTSLKRAFKIKGLNQDYTR